MLNQGKYKSQPLSRWHPWMASGSLIRGRELTRSWAGSSQWLSGDSHSVRWKSGLQLLGHSWRWGPSLNICADSQQLPSFPWCFACPHAQAAKDKCFAGQAEGAVVFTGGGAGLKEGEGGQEPQQNPSWSHVQNREQTNPWLNWKELVLVTHRFQAVHDLCWHDHHFLCVPACVIEWGCDGETALPPVSTHWQPHLSSRSVALVLASDALLSPQLEKV